MADPALSKRLNWRPPEVPLHLTCPLSSTIFQKAWLYLWGTGTGYYSSVECFTFKENEKVFFPYRGS